MTRPERWQACVDAIRALGGAAMSQQVADHLKWYNARTNTALQEAHNRGLLKRSWLPSVRGYQYVVADGATE